MKKLMFGAFAALCAGGVFAEQYDPYIMEGCDLSTYPYLSSCSQWYVFSDGGTTREWTLSSDLTKNIVQFRAYSPNWTTESSTLVFDLNQKTFTLPSYSCLLAFSQNGPSGQRAYLTFKNGTLAGADNADLQIGQDTSEYHANGTYTFENVTFNFNAIYCGRGLDNSEVDFKNCTITAPNFYFSDINYYNACNLTVKFENSKLNITNGALKTGEAGGISDFTIDVGRKHIFTGSETVVTSADSFSACTELPYVDMLITDGAEVHTQAGIYWGSGSSTGHHGTITIENSGYLNADWGLYFGWSSGNHTMVVKNGGKLKGNELDIGRYTDNNTLIVSNADISASGGITTGGYPGSEGGCPKNNRVFLYGNASEGKDNSYNSYPLAEYLFRGRNGYLYLSDTVIPTARNYKFNPVNTKQTSEADAWTGNTMFLDNGTSLAVTDFQMGSFSDASQEAVGQTLIIGNDSTLNLSGQFMNSGADNTIVISNGTLHTGTQWTFYVGYSTGSTPFTVSGNKLIFQGSHPRIDTSATSSDAYIYNDTVVHYDLPEGGDYAAVPLEQNNLVIGSAVTFEFGNLAAVRATLKGTKEVQLLYAKNYLSLPDDVVTRANNLLSGTGCYIYRDWPTEGSNAGSVYLHVVPEGLSYDAAFTSVEAYNAAVTGETTASLYANTDTYLVLSNVAFAADTDYSLALTYVNEQPTTVTQPKLHIYFYNCTFPENSYGTMNGEGPSTPAASGRKMIAINSAKEVLIQGCTFPAFTNDSYVIDFNLFNWYECGDCGITIKGNTFASGAGKRVPISVKNKKANPPAFVLIEGNTFGACKGDISDTKDVTENDTYAGVICFGDQSTSTTTAGGANFPITIQNNTFASGVTQYVVMSGMYVSSGKQGLDVPVGTSYTWAYDSEAKKWVSTPAFPKYDGEVSYDVAADGTCTIKGKGALTASTIEKIGKSNLTKLVLGADFTSVDANVFAKCYGLTEVTFQGQVTLGDGAFLRCNSLEKMNFAAMPTLGTDSIVMQSAIYMKNGLPEVYAIPEITVTGYSTVLVGKVNLTDAEWVNVTDETKKDYHFFKLELRLNP